jgi:hypothetical protein
VDLELSGAEQGGPKVELREGLQLTLERAGTKQLIGIG